MESFYDIIPILDQDNYDIFLILMNISATSKYFRQFVLQCIYKIPKKLNDKLTDTVISLQILDASFNEKNNR